MDKTWIRRVNKPKLRAPIAIVGAPGLRSVGQLAVDNLINDLKATLAAELYSSHFPVIYETSPSYIPSPDLPGESGFIIKHSNVSLPKIEFYYSSNPDLIIAKGYHANFSGQYEVAENVFVLAGYGREGEDVYGAATSLSIVDELKKYHIEKGYVGPFYGFSGLIFGLTKLRGIDAVCLFGRTKPNLEYPEDPDPQAAKILLGKLNQILSVGLFKNKQNKNS
jgi:uncharacterized protein